MPKEARWSFLKANAPQAIVGTLVDDAMTAIERDNPSLKGVLPKDFGRPGLDKQLAPYKGRVYDPCCGSGGMFVQSEKFIEAHSGRIGDISIYGQESNYTTWRLAKMNLVIRGTAKHEQPFKPPRFPKHAIALALAYERPWAANERSEGPEQPQFAFS